MIVTATPPRPKLWRPVNRLRRFLFRGWNDPVVPDPIDVGLPRADWRDPRKWHRVWRDKPGGWYWCCCGCKCDSTNTTGNTVTISFTNSGTCAALDGNHFTLTYNPGSTNYESGHTIRCGLPVDANNYLSINFGACPLGGGCSFYRLNINGAVTGTACIVISGAVPTAGCTCGPLSVVFTFPPNAPGVVHNGCTCCPGPNNITATVTAP